MKREELLNSREYWVTDIQLRLFELIEKYMDDNNLTRAQLAEKLGVTKSYITQVLNGDFDHKVSKLVDLALVCGAAPVFEFKGLDELISNEICGIKNASYQTMTLKVLDGKRHIPLTSGNVFTEKYEILEYSNR